MWLIGLAARNLARNLRRSLITGVAVVAGVALLILGFSLVEGLDENVIRAQIDTVGGHLTLTPPGYDVEGLRSPVDALEELPEPLEAQLAEHTWTRRLHFDARLIHGADAVAVRGVGYDPARDTAVFPRDKLGLEGTFPDDGAEALVVGSGLAALLDVDVGDVVTLQARTSAGAQNAQSYPIAGLVRAGNPVLDSFTVFLAWPQAQDLVRAPGPSHVAVRLDRRALTEATARALAGDWTVTTYLQRAEDLLAINRIRRKALSLLIGAVLGIAAIGIANTIIMAVYERVREIGTLAAMGMAPRAIGGMFLVEGALLGSVAALVGAAVGAVLSYRLSLVGLDLGAFPEAGSKVAMTTTLYVAFNPVLIAASSLFGLVVATVASVVPALHAVRLNPADAVRGD